MTVQMKRCPKCNKMQMAGRLHTCAVTLRDRKDDARTADEPRKQDMVQAADEALNILTAAIALDMVTQSDSTLDQVADSMTPPASDPAPAFEGGGGGYGGAGASGSWDSGTSSDSGGGGYDGGSTDSGGSFDP